MLWMRKVRVVGACGCTFRAAVCVKFVCVGVGIYMRECEDACG